MQQPELLINFFDVILSDKPLVLAMRELSAEDTLRPDEHWYKFPSQEDPSATTFAILTIPAERHSDYQPRQLQVSDLSPYLLGRLLENGLKSELQRFGKNIEGGQKSFVAFDNSDVITNSVPVFLTMRRGVEFTFDYVVSHRKLNFGFFASVKVRQHFSKGLEDPRLASIAINQDVYIENALHPKRGTLVSVDSRSKTARILDMDAREEIVAFQDIRIPASRPLLSSYCEGMGDRELANRILVRSQISSFRMNENGIKNRIWLKNELDFVRSWLNRASAGGRIQFQIPNADAEAFLSTQPSVARAGER